MSEHSGSPEVDDAALDLPEDKLSAELADEDASLLGGPEDPSTEEPEGEGDSNVGALLEESNDSVNIEDPVRKCMSTNVLWGCEILIIALLDVMFM